MITFDNGKSIQIIYDATGNKLRKITSDGTKTNYVGGIEYKDEALESVYHSEGRATPSLENPGQTVFEYSIKDHLGNSRIMFSDLNEDGKLTIGGEDSEILQEEHYYPFGMNMEGNWVPQVGVKNKYLYNGKELNGDFDLNWLDYGARWYDPAIGRWNAVDPLADQFAGWSSYNYVLNNPIRLIDPDGRAPEDVIIVFNRSTRRLAITDLDHYKSGLPSRTVSASNYVQGGIRNKKGELTHNQILVIDNVFSGGKSSKGKVERDPNNPMHRAIPVGDYDVLDNNADTRHSGWFRLDSKDDSPYNDKDETTGRDGFRLHIGSESYGCVTCDGSDGDRSSEWPVLEQILNTTSTTEVKEKRGNQWLLPWSKLTKYGTLKVQGKDNIPSKKEEKKND